MDKLKEILEHWMTGRDGISYSLTKLIGLSAGATMIYQFAMLDSKDWQGFGIGITAIMGAMAVKYMVEK